MATSNRWAGSWGVVALVMAAGMPCAGAGGAAPTSPEPAARPLPLRLVSAAAKGAFSNPEQAIDGDPRTEFTFAWGNGGAQLVLDLGEPAVVERIGITTGPGAAPNFLEEVTIGPDPEKMRGLLARPINLTARPLQKTDLAITPAVGKYLGVSFSGGGQVGIGEIEAWGRKHRPERHLCHWWSGDVAADFLEALDYLDRDLGVTDLWIDKVATALPSTRPNSGFEVLARAGVFRALQQRGIRYWLTEDEGFGGLVNSPADLRDDRRWETTLRRAREIYRRAHQLGFRGLAMDAEDYVPPSDPAVVETYLKVADHVDCWTFNDEFGYAGHYYQRGQQYGKVIREVWGGPVIQYYEAVMYAGKPGCRDGNYWWLKGMYDAGLEIWLATERTYGAGKGELYTPEAGYPEWTTRWFVDLPDYLAQTHRAYPFAARVLPGFHPWISDFGGGIPLYLPQYLDAQLGIVEKAAYGCWIYHGGTPHAGDPRKVLKNQEFLARHGLSAQDYLEVFRKHPTSRAPSRQGRAGTRPLRRQDVGNRAGRGRSRGR
jgi:hypothetical protein